MRVAIVTNMPAPYRVELFRFAGSYFAEMLVLFQSEVDPARPWEQRPSLPFAHRYLRRVEVPFGARAIAINPDLGGRLRGFHPDVVVGFGFSPTVFHSLTYSLRSRSAFVCLNDGTRFTDPVRGIEVHYRRFIVRRAAGCIAASSLAAEYLCRLGANEDRIRIVELTTDLRRIRDESGDALRREAARSRWLLEGPTACFVGRFLPSKHVRDACSAFLSASRNIEGARLIIVGDGPCGQGIKDWVEANGEGRITLVGAIPWSEMTSVYAASDVLIFPATQERFGMVVIEALAAGVPVVATRTCGAGADLIRDGLNGFLVDERDVAAMSAGLKRILESPSLRRSLGAEARTVVERHDVRLEAKRFAEALEYFRELRGRVGEKVHCEGDKEGLHAARTGVGGG